jgi:hypothetical protein
MPTRSTRSRSGDGQVVLARGGASDREGVDRVGFAVGAGGVADVRHQLRRDSDDAFAGGEQVAFQSAGYVAAVFDGPDPFLGMTGCLVGLC